MTLLCRRGMSDIPGGYGFTSCRLFLVRLFFLNIFLFDGDVDAAHPCYTPPSLSVGCATTAVRLGRPLLPAVVAACQLFGLISAADITLHYWVRPQRLCFGSYGQATIVVCNPYNRYAGGAELIRRLYL